MPVFEISDKPKQPSSDNILVLATSANNVLYDERSDSVFFTPDMLSIDLVALKDKFVYVGKMDGQEIYAIDLSGFNREGLSFVKPFGVLDTIDEPWLKPLYRSFQLLHWHKNSQHCGGCGGKTICSEKEFARSCGACKLRFYPQYSPAIIVRVTRGYDEILLGRSSYFRPGVYSTLAGFIEAGENCEEAVRREVREEVGIEVDDIKLDSIQPWPFPNSLMIGFTAQYKSGELTVDKSELEDAQWFRTDALPRLPTRRSIAYKLITDFTDHSLLKIYPKRSVGQAWADGAIAGVGAFGVMNMVKAVYEGLYTSPKPAVTPYILNSVRLTIRLSCMAAIASALDNITRQLPNPHHYQYPFLTHPVITSYAAGALFGLSSIERGIAAALNAIYPATSSAGKELQRVKLSVKSAHAHGAMACATLGVYPMVKHHLKIHQAESISTWLAGGISAAFYGLLVTPLAALEHSRSKAVLAPSYKEVIGRCLWRLPAVGLAGAICQQLAEKRLKL